MGKHVRAPCCGQKVWSEPRAWGPGAGALSLLCHPLDTFCLCLSVFLSVKLGIALDSKIPSTLGFSCENNPLLVACMKAVLIGSRSLFLAGKRWEVVLPFCR